MNQPISKDAAYFIFFGFSTDTGYFRFINAGQGFALGYASELVDLGVSPNSVYMRRARKKKPFFWANSWMISSRRCSGK